MLSLPCPADSLRLSSERRIGCSLRKFKLIEYTEVRMQGAPTVFVACICNINHAGMYTIKIVFLIFLRVED